MHRQAAGEVVTCGLCTRHVGDNGAEETFVDIEHKCRRAVHYARFDQASTRAVAVKTLITGAGFATDRDKATVRSYKSLLHASGSAIFHHQPDHATHGLRHLRSQHLFGLARFVLQLGFIRRGGREVQRLDARTRLAQAVVDKDAHQFCQCGRTVGRRPERTRIRGHHRVEGVTHVRPLTVDFQEAFTLKQTQNPLVLRPLAMGGKEPGIDRLTLLATRLHHLRLTRLRMVTQIADQPQFQGMYARHITAIGQRHVLRRILLVEFGQLGFGRFDAVWQIVLHKRIELVQRCQRCDGTEDGRQPRFARAPVLQKYRFCLLRGLALVFDQKAPHEDLPFNIRKAGKVSGAARIIGILQ